MHEIVKTEMKYPKVVIVGRMNVGKSTLFNRLAEQKKSIVFEHEGVTRDYLEELVTWKDKSFLLVDTGGFSFQKRKGEIQQRVQEQITGLLEKADLLLFVVDGKNGLTDHDCRIADLLRKIRKPVFLLVNKADNKKTLDENMPDFYALGLGKVFTVSGVHGTGIADLLDSIAQTVSAPEEVVSEKPAYRVAIIGRPNVGKSSLMNLLIQNERSIVSSIAGTTREAISEVVYHRNDLVQLTDTAGVRRSRKVSEDLEQLMVKSSLQAVRISDVVLLMIDASEGKVTDQELKLLFYAYEQKKMIITVFNKVDLLDEYTRFMFDHSLTEYDFIFKKIPQIWISCLTKKNTGKIFSEIQVVWQRCRHEFDEIQVDELVKKELSQMHLFRNTMQLKVFKVRPLEASVPTFILKVNRPELFGPSELGCIENILRKNYDLVGCPVKLIVKRR